MWAVSHGDGVSKRGAEAFRIAFVALIGDGGIRIAGDKTQWSPGYGASHGIGELRVDRLGVNGEPVAVPRRRWRLAASPGKAIPKPGAARSGGCSV